VTHVADADEHVAQFAPQAVHVASAVVEHAADVYLPALAPVPHTVHVPLQAVSKL